MPSRCCCYELNWLKPPDPVKVDLDVSFVAIIASAALYPTDVRVNELALTDVPTPSRRLHLLYCVWLC